MQVIIAITTRKTGLVWGTREVSYYRTIWIFFQFLKQIRKRYLRRWGKSFHGRNMKFVKQSHTESYVYICRWLEAMTRNSVNQNHFRTHLLCNSTARNLYTYDTPNRASLIYRGEFFFSTFQWYLSLNIFLQTSNETSKNFSSKK